jgi:hypothetical protein
VLLLCFRKSFVTEFSNFSFNDYHNRNTAVIAFRRVIKRPKKKAEDGGRTAMNTLNDSYGSLWRSLALRFLFATLNTFLVSKWDKAAPPACTDGSWTCHTRPLVASSARHHHPIHHRIVMLSGGWRKAQRRHRERAAATSPPTQRHAPRSQRAKQSICSSATQLSTFAIA